MDKKIRTGLLFFLALIAITVSAPNARSQDVDSSDSAVVFAYHRFEEDVYPETNLDLEDFKTHIEALLSQGYNIQPVNKIVNTLKTKQPLPQNTIGITLEGAYKSALTHAVPLLLEHKIPFTIFVPTDQIDAGTNQYMNWDDLRRVQKTGLVDFGILPAAYEHLINNDRAYLLEQINKAQTRLREELGIQPTLFAYPFGEYSTLFSDLIKEQGFEAAFGLHSGALYSGSNMYALPRFSMTQGYASADRFTMIARSKALQTSDISPHDPYLQTDNPTIGFSLAKEEFDHLEELSCFMSGQGKIHIEKLGEDRVILRPPNNLQPGRIRVNCTLPVRENGDIENWKWFGMLLINPEGGEDALTQPDELQ